MSDGTDRQLEVTTTTTEAIHRTPVGDNQWIAIGVLAVTYATATLFVIAGLGTVEWWGSFVGTLVPTVTGIVIGGSALIKTAAAIRGDSPKRVTTVTASKGDE